MPIDASPGKQIKRVFDLAGTLVLGLLLFIPALLIAFLIVVTSPGPILFAQQRLGKRGVPFQLYKFRSMIAEAETGNPQWARTNDPRCTPLGGFLRRTGLDEIPQLWNVVRGDMSLVGPRPERPEFARKFALSLPRYDERLQALPGLTGLAQIRGWRGDTSIDERLRSDLEYIAQWSVLLDFKILCRTMAELVLQVVK